MIRRAIGAVRLPLALAAMPFHILALVDPVGTKAADDDPFGPPPSRVKTAFAMAVTGGVGVAGIGLLKKRKGSYASPPR